MTNSKSTIVFVELDANSVGETTDGLSEVLSTFSETITAALSPTIDSISSLTEAIGIMTADLQNLVALLTTQAEMGDGSGVFSVVIDTLALLVGVVSTTKDNWIGAFNAIKAAFLSFAGTLGVSAGGLVAILAGITVAVTAIVAAGIWLYENWELICAGVLTICSNIQNGLAIVDSYLQEVFVVDWTQQFGAIGYVVNALVGIIQHVWSSIKATLSGIITFVSGVFSGNWKQAWDGIVEAAVGIFGLLATKIVAKLEIITGIFQTVIDTIASGIQWVMDLLGVAGSEAGNVGVMVSATPASSYSRAVTPDVPMLAKGAVLPANRPFLAVLGDQRHGTNVEAPLETIQQALANVMAQQGGGDVYIKFTGDLAQLARVLKPAIERENRRVGGSLAKGVV